MVDKTALGRQGEIFVMEKMMKKGWKFPENYYENMEGLDWIFEKNRKIIKVQVKTSLNKIQTFTISRNTFDYLIFTNLVDVWIIPRDIINNTSKLNSTFKKLKNRFEVLGEKGRKLLGILNDCGIKFGEINILSPFFSEENNKEVLKSF